MKIVCMPMFQEVWAVELQIDHLINHVDHIYIFEATKTFAGREKFMYLKKYSDLIVNHKVEFIKVNNLPDVAKTQYIGSNGRVAPENRWPLERAMRNAAKQVIANFPDDCIVYNLDIDEFLSIESIKLAECQMTENLVISFGLYDYRGSISKAALSAEPIIGGYATHARNCKQNDIHFMRRFVINDGNVIPSNFRLALVPEEKDMPISSFMSQNLKKLVLNNSGWHLSSMHGGYNFYQISKVQNFSHSESQGKNETVDTLVDQYAAMRDYIIANRKFYDFNDIDCHIPDFIRKYSDEFPVLLRKIKILSN